MILFNTPIFFEIGKFLVSLFGETLMVPNFLGDRTKQLLA